MNVIMINGNLTADAVSYHPGTEKAAARFCVACSKKGRDGGEGADYISMVAFGKLAERAARLKKGESVTVVGKCHEVTYQNQAGEAVRRTEVYADEIHPANSGAGVNCLSLVGSVVRDPEVRYLAGETPLAVLRTRICVFRPSASREAPNDFFDVEAFGTTAENAEKYLKKGDQVFVQGRLLEYEWQDREGEKRRGTKVTCCRITYLGSKRDKEGENAEPAPGDAPQDGFVSLPDNFDGEEFPFN